MKKFLIKKTVFTTLMMLGSTVVLAQATPPISVNTPSTFSGTSVSLFGINGISPYNYVTQQDMAAVMMGYGVTVPKPAAGNQTAFIVNPTDNTNLPSFDANTFTTDFVIGSMLTPISQDNLDQYLAMTNNAFTPKAITGSSSYTNAMSSIANMKQPDTQKYTITPQTAAPYNVASLFNYTPGVATDTDKGTPPPAYQANAAQVYIALASGALTPQSSPDNPSPSYMIQLRRLAAIQSAGVYALNEIFKRSQPLDNANTNVYTTLSGGACPSADAQGKPLTERELEKCMATRRLNPQSGWYNHVQHASPVQLQREQLYLQSEMLYELYQIHHTEEVNEALLADTLLSQNYNNRSYLNQQQQITQMTGKK